jgi:hypothetical protein
MSQIKILITDDRGNVESVSSNNSTSTINKSNGKIENDSVKKNDKKSRNLAVASMVAKQSFNYMTNNIGKWTGSTRNQTSIDNAMQVFSIGALAYINPVLAIANVGVNIATTAVNAVYDQKWDRIQKEYNKVRIGELKGMGH